MIPVQTVGKHYEPQSIDSAAERAYGCLDPESEMIIWGGVDNTGIALASGARYNPNTDNWISMSSTGAPVARLGHSAIWTGSEMIIWGGYDGNIWRLDGAGYNPVTDRWRPLPVPSISVAAGPAVWTGTEMIVWGGATITGVPTNVGAAYNPSTNSWRAISTSQAPSARSRHSATWTGEEMIVWQGSVHLAACAVRRRRSIQSGERSVGRSAKIPLAPFTKLSDRSLDRK